MANVMQMMPEIEGDEHLFVQGLMKDMADNQAQQFVMAYRARRKEPQTIMLLTILGFIGIAGVQRFMLDNIGLGLLYLFTCGLCWIGTIIDLVNYKRMTFEYNCRIAQQVAGMVRASN